MLIWRIITWLSDVLHEDLVTAPMLGQHPFNVYWMQKKGKQLTTNKKEKENTKNNKQEGKGKH